MNNQVNCSRISLSDQSWLFYQAAFLSSDQLDILPFPKFQIRHRRQNQKFCPNPSLVQERGNQKILLCPDCYNRIVFSSAIDSVGDLRAHLATKGLLQSVPPLRASRN